MSPTAMVGMFRTKLYAFKRLLRPDFVSVIRSIIEDQSRKASSPQESLREVLLRSVVTQPPDADWKINHNIALNVKEYTESIYFEGLSIGLIKGEKYLRRSYHTFEFH
jgi:hypothetical protein